MWRVLLKTNLLINYYLHPRSMAVLDDVGRKEGREEEWMMNPNAKTREDSRAQWILKKVRVRSRTPSQVRHGPK